MSVWPITVVPPLPVIQTWSMEALGIELMTIQRDLSAIGSTTVPAANRAFYIPFMLAMPIVVTRLWWENGGTVSGNVDVGIYDSVGTRIVSTGATAGSGTIAIQSVDITDTLIGPGRFFLAISCSSATATLMATTDAPSLEALRSRGAFNQETAHPLPATATFATVISSFIPVVGLLVYPRTVV